MKVAYISGKMFSDVDLSFLKEIQKIADVTYFVPVFKNNLKGAAFNLKSCYPQNGIFRAIEVYPELNKFDCLIDSSKFYVVNSLATRMWNPCNFWLYIRLAWKLREFDVIHITNFLHYYEWVLYFMRKKIVLTLHDPIPHSSAVHNRPLILLDRKFGFRWINHFILLNKVQKEACVAINHLQYKKIYISSLGRYEYLKMYAKDDFVAGRYILFFGQISSYKGLDNLLPAMVELHKCCPDIKLVLAGKGKYDFDISSYQRLDYIEFKNQFIPDDELAALIQHALFVVCPYKDATQSGVVMSAFAFNKPVIATNVGGLPEQVLHDKYGLIVSPSNEHQLVLAMRSLCENKELLDKYSSNIQADYERGEKSWVDIARGVKDIYEAVMK